MKKLEKGHYLFTSESVSAGHPDKMADAISDALLDHFLAFDKESHVAIETFLTTGQVVVAGEVKSDAYVDIPTVVRETINNIGYTKSEYQFDGNSCGILTGIHEQSPDIDMGVSRDAPETQGSGDQGLMLGYATNELDNYMPIAIDIAHNIVKELSYIRNNELQLMPYLRPDAKSQVTVEYDENNKPVRIDTIVVSTQHDEFDSTKVMHEKITSDVKNILIPRVIKKYPENIQNLFNDNIIYYVNPTGNFVIGGPAGDTGLTGRKIVVDSYGGSCPVGGGAFSGKDFSKTDRSAGYYTRYIAKNCVAAGIADRMLIQVSYAIGVANAISLYVDTYGTNKTNLTDSEIANKLYEMFDFRPYGIVKQLNLKQPLYSETAAYGHFGRTPEIVHKHFVNRYGDDVDIDVELFTWEKLDMVDKIKEEFGLN